MYVKVPWRLEESIGSPGSGVIGSCKHLMWVPGIELGLSESAASALKHQGIPPVQTLVFSATMKKLSPGLVTTPLSE